jgi:ribosomal protein L32
MPETPEAIERIARLPGVDHAAARRLVARGFTDPADVLKLALPDRAVRLGLHRTFARRLTLDELPTPRQVRKTVACPTCGTPREAAGRECPACGARGEREIAVDEVRRKLEEVAGVVYDLAADPDFQGMPEELREEILDAFEEAGFTAESEYAEQFREWRARGIDTAQVERVLREEGPEAFHEKFVRMIRAQLLKRRKGDRFECPLCEVELPANVEECDNCGAKFR